MNPYTTELNGLRNQLSMATRAARRIHDQHLLKGKKFSKVVLRRLDEYLSFANHLTPLIELLESKEWLSDRFPGVAESDINRAAVLRVKLINRKDTAKERRELSRLYLKMADSPAMRAEKERQKILNF